jgi:hypothetical protein
MKTIEERQAELKQKLEDEKEAEKERTKTERSEIDAAAINGIGADDIEDAKQARRWAVEEQTRRVHAEAAGTPFTPSINPFTGAAMPAWADPGIPEKDKPARPGGATLQGLVKQYPFLIKRSLIRPAGKFCADQPDPTSGRRISLPGLLNWLLESFLKEKGYL